MIAASYAPEDRHGLAYAILLRIANGYTLARRLLAGGSHFWFVQRGVIGGAGPSQHVDGRAGLQLLAERFVELDRTTAGGTEIFRVADRFHRMAAAEAAVRLDAFTTSGSSGDAPVVEVEGLRIIAVDAPLAPAREYRVADREITRASADELRAAFHRAPARSCPPKVCAGCDTVFTPTDGRQRRCPTCRMPAPAERGTHGARVYRRKSCARCGQEFQPTGPRAAYCQRLDCGSAA